MGLGVLLFYLDVTVVLCKEIGYTHIMKLSRYFSISYISQKRKTYEIKIPPPKKTGI